MVTPTSSVIFLFKTRVFQTFCEKTIPHSEATGYNPETVKWKKKKRDTSSYKAVIQVINICTYRNKIAGL